MNKTYPVHEVFHTFQGEGVHAGRNAFFIRLFGCPVKCPWCDSAGTWHPDYIPKEIKRCTAMDLAHMAMNSSAGVAVITGGEPAIHDLTELTYTLDEQGIQSHLETSGAFEIKGMFDWVTLSPKKWKHPVASSIARANEFKFIIEHPDDIQYYFDLLMGINPVSMSYGEPRSIWLHPEWSQRDNPAVKFAIIEAVKKGEQNYRAGWQLHKLYQVDMLDERSMPVVPLGGDPNKGY